MPPTNPTKEEPKPEPKPDEPKDVTPLTQEDLDKAVADTQAKVQVENDERMKALEKQHQTDTNQLIATMNQKNFDQQQPAPHPVPGISDADFQKGIEEGDTGVVSKFIDQKLEANNKQWEEKFGQMQTYGMDAIGNLARQQASTSPLMPYYNDFKDDIDTLLKQHNASDPTSIQNAYNLIVGQNVGKITQMEMEKKARQANAPDGSIQPGDVRKDRMDNKDQVFDADKVLSADSKKALQMKQDPLTPDQYTKKLNRLMGLKFENFESMHKRREELVQEDKEYFDVK